MAVVTCGQCRAKNRVSEERAQSMKPVCGRCGAELDVRPAEAGDTGGGDFGAEPVDVTDATLPALLERAGGRPVLVDCWAPWCGPCRMIGPTIDQLAAESGGRYVVAKLNTDDNPRTAEAFRIDGIPALLFFKNGKLVDRAVGVQPKAAIVAKLAGLGAPV